MHYITMIVLFCWFGCVGLFLPPPLRLFHLFLSINSRCYKDWVILYFCRQNGAWRGDSGCALWEARRERLIQMQ